MSRKMLTLAQFLRKIVSLCCAMCMCIGIEQLWLVQFWQDHPFSGLKSRIDMDIIL